MASDSPPEHSPQRGDGQVGHTNDGKGDFHSYHPYHVVKQRSQSKRYNKGDVFVKYQFRRRGCGEDSGIGELPFP